MLFSELKKIFEKTSIVDKSKDAAIIYLIYCYYARPKTSQNHFLGNKKG